LANPRHQAGKGGRIRKLMLRRRYLVRLTTRGIVTRLSAELNLKSDVTKWSKLVRDGNIKPE